MATRYKSILTLDLKLANLTSCVLCELDDTK
jgi:hypothetical protein